MVPGDRTTRIDRVVKVSRRWIVNRPTGAIAWVRGESRSLALYIGQRIRAGRSDGGAILYGGRQVSGGVINILGRTQIGVQCVSQKTAVVVKVACLNIGACCTNVRQ